VSNPNLYRELAAKGNDNAKAINDELGAMPVTEMGEADSEELERAHALKLGELNGRAKAHTEAGQHDLAAAVHEERGRLHEARGEHAMAASAYKDALASHRAGGWGAPAQAEADRK
jgi:hypothetical protein